MGKSTQIDYFFIMFFSNLSPFCMESLTSWFDFSNATEKLCYFLSSCTYRSDSLAFKAFVCDLVSPSVLLLLESLISSLLGSYALDHLLAS